MIAGVCRYCQCTDDAACVDGCAWTDDTQTLCTACLEAETLAEMCVRVLSVKAAEAKRPMSLVTSAWSDLAFDQKQLLVSAVKQVTERLTQSIVGELEEDVRDGLIELDIIAGFLAEERAEDLRPEESVSEAVCRLLMAECEWNPRENRPAYDDDPPHGQAIWSVGCDGLWQLCDACAKLDAFKRFRNRRLLSRRTPRRVVRRQHREAASRRSAVATRDKQEPQK